MAPLHGSSPLASQLRIFPSILGDTHPPQVLDVRKAFGEKPMGPGFAMGFLETKTKLKMNKILGLLATGATHPNV